MARPRIFGEVKCFYKPRRLAPRVFSENDAVRICCDVINGGRGTYAEINQRIAACSQSQRRDELKDEQQVEQTIQASVDLLSMMQNMYISTDTLLRNILAGLIVVVGVLTVLQNVTRFIPRARLGSVPVSVVLRQAEALVARITVQRAANDELFRRATNRVRELTVFRRAA